MLALSLTFTSLMTLIWMYRLLRYYRAYKIQQADESMGGGDAARYSLMNNA